MPEDRYKSAWEELKQSMINHWKKFPNSDLCTIPWNMMKEIEVKYDIPSKYANKGKK